MVLFYNVNVSMLAPPLCQFILVRTPDFVNIVCCSVVNFATPSLCYTIFALAEICLMPLSSHFIVSLISNKLELLSTLSYIRGNHN